MTCVWLVITSYWLSGVRISLTTNMDGNYSKLFGRHSALKVQLWNQLAETLNLFGPSKNVEGWKTVSNRIHTNETPILRVVHLEHCKSTIISEKLLKWTKKGFGRRDIQVTLMVVIIQASLPFLVSSQFLPILSLGYFSIPA